MRCSTYGIISFSFCAIQFPICASCSYQQCHSVSMMWRAAPQNWYWENWPQVSPRLYNELEHKYFLHASTMLTPHKLLSHQWAAKQAGQVTWSNCEKRAPSPTKENEAVASRQDRLPMIRWPFTHQASWAQLLHAKSFNNNSHPTGMYCNSDKHSSNSYFARTSTCTVDVDSCCSWLGYH